MRIQGFGADVARWEIIPGIVLAQKPASHPCHTQGDIARLAALLGLLKTENFNMSSQNSTSAPARRGDLCSSWTRSLQICYPRLRLGLAKRNPHTDSSTMTSPESRAPNECFKWKTHTVARQRRFVKRENL